MDKNAIIIEIKSNQPFKQMPISTENVSCFIKILVTITNL